jgi:guanylate kinase
MIFIFTGKSASGKTVLADMVAKEVSLENNIGFTTRPKRVGEIHGVHNFFVTEEELNAMDIICKKTYYPANGEVWTYGMSANSFNKNKNYAVILDPKGALELYLRFVNSRIIYIDVPDDIRRERAYGRENKELDPEIERRFKADAIDFEGFEDRADLVVLNINIQKAFDEIIQFVEENIS